MSFFKKLFDLFFFSNEKKGEACRPEKVKKLCVIS
jgi:hypothetical protein